MNIQFVVQLKFDTPNDATNIASQVKGNAIPSFSPASAVREKATGCSSVSPNSTYILSAITGSVGAKTAPKSRADAGNRPAKSIRQGQQLQYNQSW